MSEETWKLYKGTGKLSDKAANLDLPKPPPWRKFWDPDTKEDVSPEVQQALKAKSFKAPREAIEMVNAALYLRRPLLVTGGPGTGKSSLAYSVAQELGLGLVLKWPITTRTTRKDGLYSYDAIGRLQDAETGSKDNREQTGDYITLGPLGTAFLESDRPRVLLIDEVDKGDIDLPNDLLNLFEDGEFRIPELQRLPPKIRQVSSIELDSKGQAKKVDVKNGVVRCREFPLVIMTSNGEREFPAPFLRRCLRLNMPTPKTTDELNEILKLHLGDELTAEAEAFVTRFKKGRENNQLLSNDQLLQVAFLLTRDRITDPDERKRLEDRLLKPLDAPD